MAKAKLVLIDGNAVFHRAYHAIPHLTNKEGQPTNAIYGFTNMLLKVLADLKPDYAIVAWDKSSQTFRKEMYADYKATRVKAPDDLYAQIKPTRELIEALGIPYIELDNYEADDIIGTLAAKAKTEEVIIVTGDMDELQLINDNTKVYTMRRGITDTVIYDMAAMQERYGMTPAQFIDLKALKGDASDNIPGVPGVGEKTAMTLIQTYGSLDGVYEHIDEIKGSLQSKLADNKDQAYLSQKLSRIVCDAPVELDLEAARLGRYDKPAIHELFRRLDFKSLLAKLPPELEEDRNLFNLDETVPQKVRGHIEKASYHCIQTVAALDDLAAKLSRQPEFAFDTETDALDIMTLNLVGMAFSFKDGEAYYIPIGHQSGQQLELKAVIKALKPVLENPKIGKIGHNLKFDYTVMHRHGVVINPISFDTMVAAFIINPLARSQTLGDLAYSELGIEMIPIEDLIGKGKAQTTLDLATIEDVTRYAAEDADVSWRVYQALKPQLIGKLKSLADTTDWPLIPVLGDMELAGISLDTDYLSKFNKVISARILELEAEIWKLAGEQFNISSPSQLSNVLFNKLGLTVQGVRKGKTGALSTAARELEKMRGLHPIVDLIFEHRELMKLKTTYVDALPLLVSSVDGRIHTSYSQTITQTGRLNSINPNLQNIPVRTEIGRQIRHAFVAPKSRAFVSADYSQIELRVAAALSKDEAMIKAFTDGVDIHISTAAELFDVALDKVTKEQRYAAKTINFGVLYGMSAHRLTQETNMEHQQSQEFIDRYFGLRPKLKAYIDGIKKLAREQEYVETLLGRRRPCGEINSNNFMVSQAAERMAVNVPIQGTAADIMRLAMIQLAPKLEGKAELLLQIHDELIAETDKTNADEVAGIMKQSMENVYELGVPLAVETAIGQNWGELK